MRGGQSDHLAHGGRGDQGQSPAPCRASIRARRDEDARADALYGAWLCGVCLAPSAWHCTTSSVIRSRACSICRMRRCTRRSCRMRWPTTPTRRRRRVARLGRALGVPIRPPGFSTLPEGLGATMSLKDLGMPDDSVAAAVDQAMSNAYWNPRALEKRALTDLLERAFSGDAPRAA